MDIHSGAMMTREMDSGATPLTIAMKKGTNFRARLCTELFEIRHHRFFKRLELARTLRGLTDIGAGHAAHA